MRLRGGAKAQGFCNGGPSGLKIKTFRRADEGRSALTDEDLGCNGFLYFELLTSYFNLYYLNVPWQGRWPFPPPNLQ